jgi:plasmid stability protein
MTSEQQDVTKMVRVTLPVDTWRKLRLQAAEQDLSMTRLVGSILDGAVRGEEREHSAPVSTTSGSGTSQGRR